MKTLNGGQKLTIPCKIGDYCLFDTGLCIKKMRVRGFCFGYPDGLRIDLGDIEPVALHHSIVGYVAAEDDIMQSTEAVRMRRQLEYR
uniref:Uncharacterized protein n=1 Tax=Siphoviridae sp. ctbgC51 TaxID=2827901 RepID=A0A8S5TGB8_9CAUD|nr:MAG TPA: hypothetical protein [Siphoviridae sp. ctbgC51]